MDDIEDKGPSGMRYLASVSEGLHCNLLLKILTKINGESAFDAYSDYTYDERADVFQTYEDVYVTTRGTGDPDTRERLRDMIYAMTTPRLHHGDLQSAVLPLLPPSIAAMYEKNPTGETLWLGYTGTRVCDLSLPEHIVEPELYPYNRYQNRVIREVFLPDNYNSEGYSPRNWTYNYPDCVWTNRVVNFLNERACEEVCQIDENNVYVSNKYSNDKIGFIVDSFVNKYPFLGRQDDMCKQIEQLITDRVLLSQYREAMRQVADARYEDNACAVEQAANAARNIAWVALTGTDPRIYDEPIDVANIYIEYNLRDMVEEPFCVDILGYCDRNDEYDFDER